MILRVQLVKIKNNIYFLKKIHIFQGLLNLHIEMEFTFIFSYINIHHLDILMA